MAAKIRFIPRASGKLNRDELRVYREFFGRIAGEPSYSAAMRYNAQRHLAQLSRDTASHGRWPFMLLGIDEIAAITRHVRHKSRRPALSFHLLMVCFQHMDFETGEIVASRDQLADELEVAPDVVSQLMGEYVACGVISRCYLDLDGNRTRTVRYFVNPTVGTHLQGAARDEAQRAAPVLKLIDGGSRRTERRSRAARAPIEAL